MPIGGALAVAAAAKAAGAFGGSSGGSNVFDGPLGRDLRDFLRARLATPAIEDARFGRMLDQARIDIDREFDTALSKFASTRRSADRGDLIEFRKNLALGRAEALQQAGIQIALGLESQRTEGVFQYLQGKQGASNFLAGLRQKDRLGNIDSYAGLLQGSGSFLSDYAKMKEIYATL